MFQTVSLSLLQGFGVSLQIFGWTLLFGLPLGFLICFGCISRWTPISILCRTFVWIMRGTPLMLQLIVVYYGPGLLFNLPLMHRFQAVIVAFSINYACYFAEIYRGGIQSIPQGQFEAGQVLGLKKSQIFFRITALQLIKRILPAMGNEFITLVKDTSLARIIAVYEVIWNAQAYIKSAGLIWPLFYTAVFYLAATGILTLAFAYFERRLSHIT